MAASFRVGDRVKVRYEFRPGHIRTPRYIRGKEGVIAGFHGEFRNPEQLAYGGDGLPERALYFVKFDFDHVFGGPPTKDTIAIDIYEHWLEPA